MKALYKDEETIVTVGLAPELPPETAARICVPQGVAYRIIEDDVDRASVSFDTPDGYGDPEGYWAERPQGDAA